MSIKIFWLSVTFVWVLVSIFINIVYMPNSNTICIGENKKIVYKIFYTPLRLLDIRSFVSINTQNDLCNNYLKNGIIEGIYEYKGNQYYVDKYGNFEIDNKFNYREPIKIILKTKKDIKKCQFKILIYPGKLNMILNGIIFFWLPVFLVYMNLFLPIIKYFYRLYKH